MSAFRSAMKQSRLQIGNSIFFICDIQDKFRPLIYRAETMIKKAVFLNTACNILDIPCLITEHYPKALGRTVPDITIYPTTKVLEKREFSMLGNAAVKEELIKSGKRQVTLCGIESHVCLLQTALDLLDDDYEVHVVCDAASSQRVHDRAVAMNRMLQSGVTLTTSESVVFDLMKSANHPKFKDVSTLLKNHNQELNEFAGDNAL